MRMSGVFMKLILLLVFSGIMCIGELVKCVLRVERKTLPKKRMKKRRDEWWRYDRNYLDNDIEHFRRTL